MTCATCDKRLRFCDCPHWTTEELAIRKELTKTSTGETIDRVMGAFLKPERRRLPRDRPPGVTGRLKIDTGEETHTLYVTLNSYPDGRIGELFVTQDKEGGTVGALLDAVATAVSIGLQFGVPWSVYQAKFERQSFPPSGTTNDPDPGLRFVSSPLDYLARWVGKREPKG